MSRPTAADLRFSNVCDVLRATHAAGRISRSELSERLGLSVATTGNICGELLAAGVLVEGERQPSRGGRPFGRLSLNPAKGLLIGVDLAETYLHATLFDSSLAVVTELEIGLDPAQGDPEGLVRHVAGVVRRLCEQDGHPLTRLLGVGVSVPGDVDPHRGMSVFAPNWGWHDVPFAARLSEVLDVEVPVLVDNPLKAVTVAEMWSDLGQDAGDLAVVNIGTGVGIGISIRGALHRGATNTAGEWGHTTIDPHGRPCTCGARGCVESYVGALGIMRTLAERAPESPMLAPGDQAATVEALARGWQAYDPVAHDVVREVGAQLGAALGNIVNILNPEAVVLTGWVVKALGAALLTELRDTLAVQALDRALAATTVRLSDITGNPVSLGAAMFALEAYIATEPGSRTASPRAV